MTKVVILDVDGTLMDTNYQHTDAWARAFEEVGHRVPRAEVHEQIGKGSGLLIHEFVQDEEKIEKIKVLHGEIYDDLQRYGHPLPGAKELISSLKVRGYEVWFVTSAKDDELEHHMSELQAKGNVAGVVNSGAVDNPKPAPDVFELALQKAGVSPEDTVAVVDAVWDIEAADGAGVRTVAVLSGGAFSEQQLREAGAVEVYKDCAALLDSSFPE